MSARNDDLRRKIDEAKQRLALPQLLEKLGLSAHAKKRARCPFPGHDDKHPSFSVFRGEDGFWRWSCFAGCGNGDEIMFLITLKGIPMAQAIKLYLDMAGFPSSRPHNSHESPECPQSRECREFPRSHEVPEYPVSPMSNGQGAEKVLKALAARHACTQRNTARKRRWQLLRDLRAVEKRIGRELTTGELMLTFDEWYRLSQPFLDPGKTRDVYLAAFLAELRKVRVPTGEGDTFNKALEAVSNSKFSVSELPVIPGIPNADESWRRITALHRELSRLSGGKTYFLSCRDAAKACPGLNHQQAYNINLALAQLGVIKIVRVGDARPNGKAAEFRYLLPHDESPGDEDDEIPV